MWLLYVSCAWVAGIFLGSKISPPVLALSFGLIPFALIPFFPRGKKTLIVVGLCLFALLGGGLYLPSSLPPADEHSLRFYNDTGIIEIQGMVAEDPDIQEWLYNLELKYNDNPAFYPRAGHLEIVGRKK